MKEQHYRIRAGASCTIALVSDLHNTDGNPAIEVLRRRNPDLIAITGDLFLGYYEHLHDAASGDHVLRTQIHALPFLEKCVQIAPTFLSLGNHEWVAGPADLQEIRAAGVRVLDNSWEEVTLQRDGSLKEEAAEGAADQPLILGGLSSAMLMDYRRFRKKHGPAARYPHELRHTDSVRLRTEDKWLRDFEAREGVHILLCHHPEYWCLQDPFLIRHNIDLVLSGHAHGGQIRLFGQGLFAPGQGILPRYTAGVHKGPHGKLVITRGLANTAPWPIPRLFNPPEVVLIHLKKQA